MTETRKQGFFKLIMAVLSLSSVCVQAGSLPHLSDEGGAIQLHVDGEPFLMVAGELHNSSTSTIEYMEGIWPKIETLNLNTVLASISWEQFEPEEGVFDYTLIDYLVRRAREEEVKLCVIWFASWKNGQSSYAPLWVKKDTKRFKRVETSEGDKIETLSVFCDATRDADGAAFAALMKRIKEVDTDSTVVMVQPENEVGIFQDIDYSEGAQRAFLEPVPGELVDYLKTNVDHLYFDLRRSWKKAGAKEQGTWTELFDQDHEAKEYFMAWYYASFINEVAARGRAEHDLPMFVNAWLVQKPSDLPGVYPNGGPVARVMDIYKAAAPYIDIVCPDIYLPNFKEISRKYKRFDNPLLIPETKAFAGGAYFVFAELDAICFSPFGIEGAADDFHFCRSYQLLRDIAPLLLKHQGKGTMRGLLRERDETERTFELGDYRLKAVYGRKDKPSFGIVIMEEADAFWVVGQNFKLSFESIDSSRVGYIGQVWEGRYENETFTGTRLMNGDETFHNQWVRVYGHEHDSGVRREIILEENDDEPFVYSASKDDKIVTPAVYRVTTYMRD